MESRAAQRAKQRGQPPLKGVSGKSWEDFVFCEELGVRVDLHTAKVRVGRKGKRNKEPGWRKKRAVWTGEVMFTVVAPKGCRNEGGMRFPLSTPQTPPNHGRSSTLPFRETGFPGVGGT